MLRASCRRSSVATERGLCNCNAADRLPMGILRNADETFSLLRDLKKKS